MFTSRLYVQWLEEMDRTAEAGNKLAAGREQHGSDRRVSVEDKQKRVPEPQLFIDLPPGPASPGAVDVFPSVSAVPPCYPLRRLDPATHLFCSSVVCLYCSITSLCASVIESCGQSTHHILSPRFPCTRARSCHQQTSYWVVVVASRRRESRTS